VSPGTAGQVLAVARRELAVERAGREALVTTVPFVAAFVVLAGLAFGPDPRQLVPTGPGSVWLAVLVATVPLSRAVAAAEVAEDSWDLVRALVRPGALFAGKLLAVWAGLALTWLLAGGLVVVLFGTPVPPQAVLGGVVGTLALAALTTAFGVLVASGARRRGLLAALLLPAGLPALLAGTQLASTNVPVLPWAVLVVLYAGVVLVAAWAVFPALLEE
jgi:heme exporter protein B